MMIFQNISSLVISLSTLCEQVNKKGLASLQTLDFLGGGERI
jgi:hypothetical protein